MSSSIDAASVMHGVHFAIGTMLVMSALHKLANGQSWLQELSRYEVFSSRIVTSIASRTIPLLEFVIGIALVVQVWPVASALGAVFLFVIFLGAVNYAIFHEKEISCGCLGGISKGGIIGKKTIGRLLLLIAAVSGPLFLISQNSGALVQSRSQWIENSGLGMAFGVPILLLWILSELLPEAVSLVDKPSRDQLRPSIHVERKITQ